MIRNPSTKASAALRVFTVMWAVSVILRLGNTEPLVNPGAWALALTGFTALVFPRIGTLAALCFAQALSLFLKAPFVSNMWMFSTMTAAILFPLLAYLVYARRREGDAEQVAWRWGGGIIRINVVILYFFVVFHKLNHDYLNLVLSCGTEFWEQQRATMPFLPDGNFWKWSSIIGTLVVEAGIPILLCVRRTRLLGILVLVLFHGAIGLNPKAPYYVFGAMLFAISFAFGSAPLLQAWERFASRLGGWADKATWGLRAALVLLLAPAAFLSFDQKRYLVAFWMLYASVYCAWVVAALIRKHASPALGLGLPRWWLLGPVMIALNGFSPYFGLKLETSFAMYSNLRLSGEWNHLIVPRSLQVFEQQQDVVHIVDASFFSKRNSHRVKHRLGMWTTLELRRYLSGSDDPWIVVESGGERRKVDVALERPDLLEPLPWWQAKLMRFTTTPVSSGQPCAH